MSYCEIPEFYAERESVARKRQQCCECYGDIEPGERYVACSGKWEGSFFTEKQHLCCYHVARFVNQELKLEDSESDGEGCIAFGGIRHALKENADTWFDDNDDEHREEFGVDQCENVLGFWNGWLSGVKERFELGAGI